MLVWCGVGMWGGWKVILCLAWLVVKIDPYLMDLGVCLSNNQFYMLKNFYFFTQYISACGNAFFRWVWMFEWPNSWEKKMVSWKNIFIGSLPSFFFYTLHRKLDWKAFKHSFNIKKKNNKKLFLQFWSLQVFPLQNWCHMIRAGLANSQSLLNIFFYKCWPS